MAASKKGTGGAPGAGGKQPLTDLQAATPGCGCSRCHRIRGIEAGGRPDGRSQGGRAQFAATELGWHQGGDEGGSKLRGHEAADREFKDQRGLTELPASFRYLVGPAPKLNRADFTGARAHLTRILSAIEYGGWTRSEWARLYRMRDKWMARATGQDPRFNEIGNRTGGLNPNQLGRVKMKRAIGGMMGILKAEVPGGNIKG